MRADSDERDRATYVKKLHDAAQTGEQVHLSLDTDDRVLARVTDGIYRQPASAIRELLANAYDADATEVAVITDAPRYSEIMVRDNGNGMTAPVLYNLIRHIGGGAKRTPVGQELGITRPDNSKLSPGGRKLIGKIGIGLFSVSQLTRQFTIITKPRDEEYRYKAVVTLHRYTDEELDDAKPGKKFRTGKTVITSEVVGKDEASGTTIVLGSLIPRVKEILQSKDTWDALLNPQQDTRGVVRRIEPAIHSGYLKPGTDEYQKQPNVPWAPRTKPNERMMALVKALLELAEKNELHAQLENAFDYYYRMIWQVGLSLPLPYIEVHPFDLPDEHTVKCFRLSNRTRAASVVAGDDQVTHLRTSPKTTVAAASGINPHREGNDFRVEIDGLRLYRPIMYDSIPGTSRALQTPLLFVGGFNPDLQKYDKSQRGGQNLEFTGYFYWAPRVIPKEHIGLLVRSNGASGTLFDTTFLNYQIAERQRLKQIVAEVFVCRGLEEALNIDRESFNTAHPHYQILLNWVHNALRQVINKQKSLESEARTTRNTKAAETSRSAVQNAAQEELRKILGDESDTIREVCFTDDESEKEEAEEEGKRVFPRNVVIDPMVAQMERLGTKAGDRILVAEEKAIAIARILDAYELLDHHGPHEQARLLTAIIRIFCTGEK